MKLNFFELEGSKPREIETEIRFIVASERASGSELVCLWVCRKDSTDEAEIKKNAAYVNKLLKTMKREQSIRAFAFVDGFDEGDTDCAYLLNKYPEIDLGIENAVYIKI